MADNWIIEAGSTTVVGGGSGAASAGNVTAIMLSSRPSGDGKRDIIAAYTKPDPVGTFAGVVVYVEEEDQSSAPPLVADGTMLADGTHGAGGEWKPKQVTRKKHVDGQPAVFTVDEPNASKTIRVYLNSYNTDDAENALVRATDASPTPNATITLMPMAYGPSGEEFSKNPTDCTVVDSFTVLEGGVLIRHIKSEWAGPVGGDGVYVEVFYESDGEKLSNGTIGTAGYAENWFPEPKTSQVARIQWRGFVDQFPGIDDDLVNSYAPGITPEASVSIGTTTGTVDLGEGIAASVAPSMAVLNKVLGVAPLGITNDLVAVFAISQGKLENAQIIDAARIVDDAVTNSKLGSLAVNTPEIADFAVQAAKIAALAVTTAAIDNAAITNAKIGALSVATANIQDTAISTAKIANAAITTVKIQNAAITNALIANLAVATANIQDLAVTNGKIANLAVEKLLAGSMLVVNDTDVAIAVVASSGARTQMSASTYRARNPAGDYGELGISYLELKAAISGTSGTFLIDSGDIKYTTATAGLAVLPSAPAGFLRAMLNGGFIHIPYYNN